MAGYRALWLVALVASCTVGSNTPSTTPPPAAAPAPDQMSEEVLAKHDAGRDYDRPPKGGTNVCGSMCNPCKDITRPDPPPGCLNALQCTSSGPGADSVLVYLAIAVAIGRRKRRRVYAPAREDDPVLEEHLNQLP